MNDETNEIETAHEKKMRLAPRYHLTGNDCLIESSDIRPSLAKLIDVSNSGALIHARKHLGNAGDTIDVYLKMDINDENNIFAIKSVIKNVRTEENSGLLMYGIEFIDVDEKLALQLKNYMYKSLTE